MADKVEKDIDLKTVNDTFLTFFNNLGTALQEWANDIKAIEIVTAAGSIKFNIEDSKSDITNMINSGTISADLRILARTRIELDGDVLVVLPTKEEFLPTEVAAKLDAGTKPPDAGTKPPDTGAKSIIIDNQILDIHNGSVNMAMQNLQFVFKNVSDWISKLIESGGKDGIRGFFKL